LSDLGKHLTIQSIARLRRLSQNRNSSNERRRQRMNPLHLVAIWRPPRSRSIRIRSN